MNLLETPPISIIRRNHGIEHATVQLERAGLPATSGYVMPEPATKP